jgi:hypothetical protein
MMTCRLSACVRGTWPRRLGEVARLAVLIFDDFGLRELTFAQADDIYELITDRTGGSLILTSNRAPAKAGVGGSRASAYRLPGPGPFPRPSPPCLRQESAGWRCSAISVDQVPSTLTDAGRGARVGRRRLVRRHPAGVAAAGGLCASVLVADGPRLKDGVHRLRHGHGQAVLGGPSHDEAVQGL